MDYCSPQSPLVSQLSLQPILTLDFGFRGPVSSPPGVQDIPISGCLFTAGLQVLVPGHESSLAFDGHFNGVSGTLWWGVGGLMS